MNARRPSRAAARLRCLWRRGCSGCRRARPPARLGDLTSFGAAPRSPPVPSGPSGALHTGGACGSGVPGQAQPLPTSTAAGPSGALHTGGDCGAVWCRPGPAAAHRHRGRALRRPSHQRRCVAVNSPARPRRSQRAPQPGPAATAQVSCPDLTCRIAETAPNFARNSPATISNIEFRSLELQRFGALLNVHPIELRAKLRCGVSLLWSSLLLRGIALLG